MPPLNIPFAFWAAAAGGGGGGGAPTIADAKSGTDDGGGSGDNISITFSSAVSAGDYIILAFMSGPASNFINTPSGFTKLYGNTSTWSVFVKKAVGTEGATFTVGDCNEAGILAALKITGAGSTPLDVSGQAASTNTGGSITTTAANDLVISIWMSELIANYPPTVPAGYTLVAMPVNLRVNSAGGGPIVMGVAQINQAAAGATGTQAWTPSSGTATAVVTIAVKPT